MPRWKVRSLFNSHGWWKLKSIYSIVTLGIVLAKKVFAVHGVDVTGKPIVPTVPRATLREFGATLELNVAAEGVVDIRVH